MTNIEKPIYISREEKNGITKELLNEYFDYKDGFLYWKVLRQGCEKSKLAGSISSLRKGGIRRVIGVDKNQYLASRLIFLYYHGYLPPIVDHEDRNTLNDTINNLRAANISQNISNQTSHKNSSSKYLGVSWSKCKRKWEVRIMKNGKKKFGGYFKIEIEAAKAYNHLAMLYFGEFANLNIIQD